MKAGIGQFVFQKAPCAYHQTITAAFHPNNYKQPRILVREVLAAGAQRLDAENAALLNHAPHRETASQVTDIFQVRSFGELAPGIIDSGDFHLRMQKKTFVRPAFVNHFRS